jgi:hypothetical protein
VFVRRCVVSASPGDVLRASPTLDDYTSFFQTKYSSSQ